MIFQPQKSGFKGTRCFSRSRSIPQASGPIEGKMIVRPLKSALKGTRSSSRPRSILQEPTLIEGKMIVQPLKSALKGTRWFFGSGLSPRESRPIEGKWYQTCHSRAFDAVWQEDPVSDTCRVGSVLGDASQRNTESARFSGMECLPKCGA
jgi:hypothetical protein